VRIVRVSTRYETEEGLVDVAHLPEVRRRG